MIRVVLFGACGRMGRMVMEELTGNKEFLLVAGIESSSHPELHKIVDRVKILSDHDNLPEADVWLDFSLPEPALFHADLAAQRGIPTVIAVTGFGPEQSDVLKAYSRRIAILLAPNLSIGMGVMERLAAQAATLLGSEYQAAIVETHHRGKKDAPSGSALRLSEILAATGQNPEISSLRLGSVVGEHTIRFAGTDDELTITHRAWSRRAFNRGVPHALRFAVNSRPGLYTLRDLYAAE